MIIIALIIILWHSFNCTAYINNWEPRISLPGQCGPLEFYNECGSSCRTDCYTIQNVVPCVNHQCLEGCYCKGGFLRSGRNKACIKEKLCPKFREDGGTFSRRQEELEKLISEMLAGDRNLC